MVNPLRQFSPHWVEAEFGQTWFRGVKPDTLPIQFYAFTLLKRFYISFLVLGAFYPAWITASFGFQFLECIYIVHGKSLLACFGVVLGHLILVEIIDLDYTVSLLHSLTSCITQVPVKARSSYSVCVHSALGGVNACSTKSEHEFNIRPVGEDGMVQLVLANVSNILFGPPYVGMLLLPYMHRPREWLNDLRGT